MEAGCTNYEAVPTADAPAASNNKQFNSNPITDQCSESKTVGLKTSDTKIFDTSFASDQSRRINEDVAVALPAGLGITREYHTNSSAENLSTATLPFIANMPLTNSGSLEANAKVMADLKSGPACNGHSALGGQTSGGGDSCAKGAGGGSESVDPETILSKRRPSGPSAYDISIAAAGDGNRDQDVQTRDKSVVSNSNLINVIASIETCTPVSGFNDSVGNSLSSVTSLYGLSGTGGKTLNDVEEENEDDDEDAIEKRQEQQDDIKPLLCGLEQEKRRLPTKGIVKSPSCKSFGADNENGDASTTQDRPVLHVKFHPNGGPQSMYGSSPASSVSSTSSSSSDDEESSSGQYSEAKPPDGGWGWVVVFASFVVNLIADGITFSFGVIYVEFLNYFGEGKGKTAWIGSLFMAMPLLSGPIASFLTDRYGCRKVTIAGSILACIGFVLSAFSTSMEMLFLTFGILAGFGLSLCYVAAVVIVAYYFDKRRSFATGLSVCGSGIGTFIFAPLTQMLIKEYGWRGTTLILAGFFLNMTVCGMLMRDLEWTTHRAKLKAKERKNKNRLGVSADSFSVSNSTNTGGTASNLNNAPFNIDDMFNKIEPSSNPRLFSSLITLPTFMRNGEKIPAEVLELMASHRDSQTMHPTLSHSRSFSEPLSTSRLSNVALSPPEGALSPTNPERQRFEKAKNRQIQNEQAFMTWLKRDGAINPPHHRDHSHRHPTSAYLKDLKMHRHSLTYRGAMLNINRYRLRASSCPDIYRNSMTTIAKEKFEWGQGIREFKKLFADMLDLSYFADIRFLLFALSNFFLYTWYDVPYVYLADYAIGLKISDADASMLISAIGIVNMFGEIFLGWCGDKKYMTAGMIYAICMGLCGIVTACVPLMRSFMSLSFISGLFGLFIAANYALTSIILVELITLDRFTNAYGLLLLVQGIANLVGPPLAGWITDVTGDYHLAFYISGFFIAVSGGLMFILPVQGKVKKYQNMQRQKKEARDSITSNIRDEKLPNGVTSNVFGDCFGKDNENNV